MPRRPSSSLTTNTGPFSPHTGTPQLVVCRWRGQEALAVQQEAAAVSVPTIVSHVFT